MRNQTYYTGLDLHKEYSYIVVKTYEGSKVKKGRVDNSEEALNSFFREFIGCNVTVALEATCNYYWMYRFLAKLGFKVKLAHPYKTRIIGEAKIKTDKIDANILADLVRTNMLPESYIPNEETLNLRELIRYRMRLVRTRTLLKNQVHAILMKSNFKHSFSDLFGKAGLNWIKTVTLRPELRYQIDQLIPLIEHFNKQIKDNDKKTRKLAIDHKIAKRLMGIDGISYFSALLLVAEIGDIERFPTPKHLSSFAGLTPSVHSSGKTNYTSNITKQGNKFIRWVLCEAANKAVRRNRQLQLFFEDIKKAKGHAKAIVATTRKMLTGIYHVWKYNAEFKPVRHRLFRQVAA